MGATPLRRCRARRQDARGDRLRAHRPARRGPCAGAGDAGHRPRPVRVGRALPRAPGDLGLARERAPPGGLRDAPRPSDRRHAKPDQRRAPPPDEEGRADRERRPRRPGRPGRAGRRARVGARRRGGARRLPRGALHVGADPRARERRRHAAPRGVDPGGTGPRRASSSPSRSPRRSWATSSRTP